MGTVTNAGTYVTGSDFSEALPARSGKQGFEPGDVLVLSDEEAGSLEVAQQPNDPRVAGVYSARPGMLGADKAGESRVDENDVPVAIVGIVLTKVSAEHGPIKPGGLLTTASTPGHAMKVPRRPEPGTVLGKALEGLPEGTGVIRVLVTLR